MQCHGSQCGFCTPGFVMSLFGMYQNHVCRGETDHARAGAGGTVGQPVPLHRLPADPGCGAADGRVAGRACRRSRRAGAAAPARSAARAAPAASGRTWRPRRCRTCSRARAAHPDAQIVAGCTDVGLWVTKMHMQFDEGAGRDAACEELRRVEQYDNHIAIGAAVTLTDAFDALVAERPQLKTFANRFAGLPVRNSGTLGGNVANGSPIGDSMPLLIALDAHVVLMSSAWPPRHAAGGFLHRLPQERAGARRGAGLDQGAAAAARANSCAPTRSPSATTTTSPPCAWW